MSSVHIGLTLALIDSILPIMSVIWRSYSTYHQDINELDISTFASTENVH